LDLLVLQELAFQAATRQGLRLGAGVLDKAMVKLKADAGSEEEYRKFLEKEHMTEADLRIRVERNLLIQQILTEEVVTKIVIPEDDLQKEYERTRDRFMDPEKISVTDVTFFLKLDDPASMEQANAILARINTDKDKDPGNLVSDGTFLVQSYELEKAREPLLYEAVRKLKVGEVSGVIKTRDSIHIIKLTNYIPERPKTYKEVRSVIEGRLKAATQKTRRQEWERELKQGARIEIMDEQEHVQ
jgi:parvulin-like peptidyl-prolyl isomerase